MRALSLWRLQGSAMVSRWFRRFVILDLWRGVPAWFRRGSGIFPGCRCGFLSIKILPPAASYDCDSSQSSYARGLSGINGGWCRSSPSSSSVPAVGGVDLQVDLAQSSSRIGLLFSISSRGFCANVLGQLSPCILLVVYLFLYPFVSVLFLTMV